MTYRNEFVYNLDFILISFVTITGSGNSGTMYSDTLELNLPTNWLCFFAAQQFARLVNGN